MNLLKHGSHIVTLSENQLKQLIIGELGYTPSSIEITPQIVQKYDYDNNPDGVGFGGLKIIING